MFFRSFVGWATLAIVLFSVPARAQSNDAKIQELEQRIAELERLLKVSQGIPAAPAESATDAAIKAGNKPEAVIDKPRERPFNADGTGFGIRSGDGNFVLKVGADLQVDNRSYLGDGGKSQVDTILLRRVRPIFSGTVYKYIDFFIRPDFGSGSTIIYDAYMDLKYFSAANLRVGKFKPPVGLERLQSDDDTNFVERGLPTLLVPSRDIGYQLSGNLLNNRFNYSAGVFNGVPDNGLSEAAASSHRDYAGRFFFTPFKPNENALSGLGFGAGVSGGGVDNVALPSYKTVGQSSFFTFNSGVVSAGHRTRWTPQAYYYVGPFGLLTEYTRSEEGFRNKTVQKAIEFRAWQVQATYILTGEKKTFYGVVPNKRFDPLNHGWGAIELAGRVGDFSADKGIYGYGFVNPATAARRLHEWVGGVNWYLNRELRISLDYGHTNFLGGASKGNRLPEQVLLTRFQINL